MCSTGLSLQQGGIVVQEVRRNSNCRLNNEESITVGLLKIGFIVYGNTKLC